MVGVAIGAVGIVIGLATYGWRVIQTIGQKITELTPSRGFAAELAAASTVVLASATGLPISTTYTLVGAVPGVGLARGVGGSVLPTIGKRFSHPGWSQVACWRWLGDCLLLSLVIFVWCLVQRRSPGY